MFCKYCRNEEEDDSLFCSICGQKIAEEALSPAQSASVVNEEEKTSPAVTATQLPDNIAPPSIPSVPLTPPINNSPTHEAPPYIPNANSGVPPMINNVLPNAMPSNAQNTAPQYVPPQNPYNTQTGQGDDAYNPNQPHYNYSPQNAPISVLPTNEELLRGLIGSNADYYLKSFEKIKQGKSSINMAALFFHPFLFAIYRKHYVYLFNFWGAFTFNKSYMKYLQKIIADNHLDAEPMGEKFHNIAKKTRPSAIRAVVITLITLVLVLFALSPADDSYLDDTDYGNITNSSVASSSSADSLQRSSSTTEASGTARGSGLNKEDISIAKNLVHKYDNPKQLTYEEAFDTFFDNRKWELSKNSYGDDVVLFSGECYYADKYSTVELLFGDEGDGLELLGIAINDSGEPMATLLDLTYCVFKTEEESDYFHRYDYYSSQSDISQSPVDLLCIPDGRISMEKIVLYEGTIPEYGKEFESLGYSFELTGLDGNEAAYCNARDNFNTFLTFAKIGTHPRDTAPVEEQWPWIATAYNMPEIDRYVAVNDELEIGMQADEVIAIANRWIQKSGYGTVESGTQIIDGEECYCVVVDYEDYHVYYKYDPYWGTSVQVGRGYYQPMYASENYVASENVQRGTSAEEYGSSQASGNNPNNEPTVGEVLWELEKLGEEIGYEIFGPAWAFR